MPQSSRMRTSTRAEGVVYRRLSQQSSALYHGLWETHIIHEQLYRDTRERGGPTTAAAGCQYR